MKFPTILKFVISVGVCELAGIVGTLFTAPAISSWYATLEKPALSPPNWIFGPVWIALYFLMGVSLYLVWAAFVRGATASQGPKNVKGEEGKKLWNPLSDKLWRGSWREENAVAIFFVQLGLNILWPILFFGLKLSGVAFIELLMLWVAIAYTIVNFYRISKPAAIVLVPYLLWITFAAYLNYALFVLNR